MWLFFLLVFTFTVMNQSAYVDCFLPMPEKLCNENALNQLNYASPMLDLLNCCSQEFELDSLINGTTTTPNVAKRRSMDNMLKPLRKCFEEISSKKSQIAPRVKALLHCYGVEHGTEVMLRHLYPIG